jgi:Amt family ammonium transporter
MAGNIDFFLTQVKALGIVVGYSFIVSYGIFKLINLINPIRVSVEEEELGLDETQHNEKYLQGTLLVSNNGHMKEETLSDF